MNGSNRLSATILMASEAFKWSNLGRLGRSRLVKLTIIAPFFGYLILFNSTLAGYLAIALNYIADDPSGNTSAHHLSFYHLYFLYFGLIFVGCSSLLFQIFCPEDIAPYENVNFYVIEQERILSDILIKSSVIRIFEYVWKLNQQPDISAFSTKMISVFPLKVRQRFDLLVYGLISKSDFSPYEDNGDLHNELFTGSGYVNIDGVTDIVANQRAVHRQVNAEFDARWGDLHKDIFTIDYMIQNYSSPSIRCAIGVLYVFGSIVLFVPSLVTAFKILIAIR